MSDVVSAKLEMQSPRSLRVGAISFSKQEILECLPIVGYGTTFLKVYNYVRVEGLNFAYHYPYTGVASHCRSLVLRLSSK